MVSTTGALQAIHFNDDCRTARGYRPIDVAIYRREHIATGKVYELRYKRYPTAGNSNDAGRHAVGGPIRATPISTRDGSGTVATASKPNYSALSTPRRSASWYRRPGTRHCRGEDTRRLHQHGSAEACSWTGRAISPANGSGENCPFSAKTVGSRRLGDVVITVWHTPASAVPGELRVYMLCRRSLVVRSTGSTDESDVASSGDRHRSLTEHMTSLRVGSLHRQPHHSRTMTRNKRKPTPEAVGGCQHSEPDTDKRLSVSVETWLREGSRQLDPTECEDLSERGIDSIHNHNIARTITLPEQADASDEAPTVKQYYFDGEDCPLLIVTPLQL